MERCDWFGPKHILLMLRGASEVSPILYRSMPDNIKPQETFLREYCGPYIRSEETFALF